MSTDFSKPVVGDSYTLVPSEINQAIIDLAKGLEPTNSGTHTNVPTNTIRWNKTNNYWELYNGTSWVALTATYAISISGNAATVTNGLYSTGSYADPAWLTALAWGKISSKPTTVSGYGITDAITTANIGSQSVASATNATNAANVTGTIGAAVTGTTQAVDDNSTKPATTGWYTNQASAATPADVVANSAGSVGTSNRWARADHTHSLGAAAAAVNVFNLARFF